MHQVAKQHTKKTPLEKKTWKRKRDSRRVGGLVFAKERERGRLQGSNERESGGNLREGGTKERGNSGKKDGYRGS